MNAARRKTLDEILTRLSDAKADLEEVANDERFAFESLPESLQEAERGQHMSEIADSLDEAVSNLEDVVNEVTIMTDKTIHCVGCGKPFTAPTNSTRAYCEPCTARRMVTLAGSRPTTTISSKLVEKHNP